VNKVSNFQLKYSEQNSQVPHNSQSAFCFTLIHVQLLAPSCARTNKYLIADLTVGITVFLVIN